MSTRIRAVVFAVVLLCSSVATPAAIATDPSPGDGVAGTGTDEATVSAAADPALVVSRDAPPVGSPVSLRVSGTDGDVTAWTLASAPDGSDAELYTHGRTATLRPDVAGEYVVRARTEDGGTASATVTATGTSRLELLRRYAPVVSFHANESYYPTRLESLVYNARLETFGAPDTDFPSMFSLADRSDDWELDLHDGEYTRYDDRYPPTVYGSVHRDVTFRGESYTAVTYWLFYVYDPKQDGFIAGLLSHQSDTETVTILVNDSGPQWLGASQHYGGERREWAKVDRRDTHPTVYPALGAHSNYLRDTGAYDGRGILPQSQFVNESSTQTDVFEPAVSVYRDRTGDATTWSHNGENSTEYQIAVLTGNEVWASYEGSLVPDDGTAPIPMERRRWTAPGRWMETTLAADERQVDAAIDRVAVEADGELVAGRATIGNTGPKPHPMVVVLEAKPVSASWEEGSVVLNTTTSHLGTERSRSVVVRGAPPEPGEWSVRVRVSAYPPSVAESEDVLAVSRARSVTVVARPDWLPDVPFVDLPKVPQRSGLDDLGTLLALGFLVVLILATGGWE